MARVLIAGCGALGSALGERLAGEGCEVFGLRRDPRGLPGALRPVAADLLDPELDRALPQGIDLAAYTAAPDAYEDAAYRAAYGDGLANLLGVLERRDPPPRRVVLASSTSVYGQQDGAWVEETSPAEPADFAGARVLEGERRLRDSPIPGCALRFGGIYGPGRTGLIERVRAGRAVCPEGPPRYTNRIHLDDAAGALRHALRLDRPDPVYVAVDCDPADLCTVYRWLAERLGAPPPPVGPPPAAGRRARTNKRCSNTRLLASGFIFRYPTFREGYTALLSLRVGLRR